MRTATMFSATLQACRSAPRDPYAPRRAAKVGASRTSVEVLPNGARVTYALAGADAEKRYKVLDPAQADDDELQRRRIAHRIAARSGRRGGARAAPPMRPGQSRGSGRLPEGARRDAVAAEMIASGRDLEREEALGKRVSELNATVEDLQERLRRGGDGSGDGGAAPASAALLESIDTLRRDFVRNLDLVETLHAEKEAAERRAEALGAAPTAPPPEPLEPASPPPRRRRRPQSAGAGGRGPVTWTSEGPVFGAASGSPRRRTAPRAPSSSLQRSMDAWNDRQKSLLVEQSAREAAALADEAQRRRRLLRAASARPNAAMRRLLDAEEARRRRREEEARRRAAEEEEQRRSAQFRARDVVLRRGDDWKTRLEREDLLRRQRVHAHAVKLASEASLPRRMAMHKAASDAQKAAAAAGFDAGAPAEAAPRRRSAEEPAALTQRLRRQQARWDARLEAKRRRGRRGGTVPEEQPIEVRQREYQERKRARLAERERKEAEERRRREARERRRRERLLRGDADFHEAPRMTYAAALKAETRRREAAEAEEKRRDAAKKARERERRLRETSVAITLAIREQERERRGAAGAYKTADEMQRERRREQQIAFRERKAALDERIEGARRRGGVARLVAQQSAAADAAKARARALVTVARAVGSAADPNGTEDEWIAAAANDAIFDEEEKAQLGLY